MKRIITSLIVALPLIVTTLPKPASALSITANPQVNRYVDGSLVAQYDRRDGERYNGQEEVL